ncbi:MAG: acetate--CoA ligase family protein [Candidatus Pacebacteria bacterium]|nr:acetate--CoA ligase family protein [Candidatus Paceibacterota bacterium]
MSLKSFFSPQSLAVVGASSNPEKIGYQIVSNLKQAGYQGKIYPVNLNSSKILGLKSYSSLLEIKAKVDLVVIAIPAPLVKSEVEKCVQLKIKNVVIISAGFKELNKEGAKMEAEIFNLAKENNLNILGPNCLGFIAKENHLNATFAKVDLNSQSSQISLVSQSGAIGSAMLDWFAESNLSLANFVSLGNKVDIAEDEVFDYLKDDKEIKLVVAYLEEIKNGKKLRQSLSALAKKKPVIVIKAGKSQAGTKMALSHTGSLAGSFKTVKLALESSGAILIDNLEELFELLKLWPSLKDKSLSKIFNDLEVMLVSNAGGPLVIAADLLEEYKLSLAKWSKSIKSLKDLPKGISLKNPLDILGDAPASRYFSALKPLLEYSQEKVFVIVFTPQSVSEPKKTAEIIVNFKKQYRDKLFIPVFIGGKAVGEAKKIFAQENMAYYDCLEPALFALAKYGDYIKRLKSLQSYQADKDISLIPKNQQLDYLKSFKLLKKYGLNIVENKKISSVKDLDKLKFPAVLKATGEKLIHKTEKEAVVVGIENTLEAQSAYKKLQTLFSKGADTIVFQPFIKNNLELIAGFKRDKDFGIMFMLGWGGIYAEVLQDTAWHLGYLKKADAYKMLKSLKVYKIISGFRGKKYSQEKIVNFMLALSRLAQDNLQIQELDINPLFVDDKSAKAGDVRIII